QAPLAQDPVRDRVNQPPVRAVDGAHGVRITLAEACAQIPFQHGADATSGVSGKRGCLAGRRAGNASAMPDKPEDRQSERMRAAVERKKEQARAQAEEE